MDPDFLMTLMLENYTKVPIMTFEESKSEFSFWALWASHRPAGHVPTKAVDFAQR